MIIFKGLRKNFHAFSDSLKFTNFYSLSITYIWKLEDVTLYWFLQQFYKTLPQISFFLPVQFGQSLPSSSYRMSLSTLMDRAWILKMWVRPCNVSEPINEDERVFKLYIFIHNHDIQGGYGGFFIMACSILHTDPSSNQSDKHINYFF